MQDMEMTAKELRWKVAKVNEEQNVGLVIAFVQV